MAGLSDRKIRCRLRSAALKIIRPSDCPHARGLTQSRFDPYHRAAMKIRRLSLALLLVGIQQAISEDLLPTAPGTTWKYQMTQEFGRGVRPTDGKPDADGKFRAPVDIVVTGSEEIDGIETHKLEMRRQGVTQVTRFLQVNDSGLFELARSDESGERVKLTPPQKTLSFPLKVGDKWEYRGEGGGEQVEEVYEIMARETVEVPAGKFDAYHLRVVGTKPFPSVVDRWFVSGLGEVKDVTEVKRADGSMVQRLSFELTAPPDTAASADKNKRAGTKRLSVVLCRAPEGESVTDFKDDVQKIFARWQAHDLSKGTKLRAVWIAEDVGSVAPANYKIDEASVVAPAPPSNGVFSLSRPNDGWPAGSYRVEVYANDELTETTKFSITAK